MHILIIDGQGGRIGKQLVTSIRERLPELELTAVGTNSIATASMLKAGAEHIATGENAVIVNSRQADIIIGPIGIVIADALLGEVTPAMAVAVGQSKATKILIPMHKCENIIAGMSDRPLSVLIDQAVETLAELAAAG